MTRWARGAYANRKKPLDATKWTEMMSDDSGLNDNTVVQKKPTAKQSLPQKFKKKSGSKQKTQIQSKGLQQNAAHELEKLGKESALVGSLSESVVLEEFVHKETRREARRLRRQEQKQQARVCYNCRQQGHDLASCPQVVGDVDHGTGVCFKCGSTEHKINACKVKLAHGQFPFAKCFICGQVGHLSRSCPDNPRGLYPNGGCCNHCGSVEHFKRDCPELQKQRGTVETTLSTLDKCTNMDEEPALKRPKSVAVTATKTNVVTFK